MQQLTLPRGQTDHQAKKCYPLACCLIFYLLVRGLDRVCQKHINDRMQNYLSTYVTIIFPISACAFKFTALLIRCIIRASKCKSATYNQQFSMVTSMASPWPYPTGFIKLPHVIVLLAAALDQLGSTWLTIPGPYLSLPSQSLFCNSQLVYTVLISSVWLSTKYRACHYLGCILVCLSAIVSINVELHNGHSFTYVDGLGVARPTSPWWYLIFATGYLPLVLENCVVQKYGKAENADVMWFVAWSSLYQVFFALLLIPVAWLPLPSPAITSHPSEFTTQVTKTFTCFLGTPPTSLQSDQACAAPGGAPWQWFLCGVLCYMVSSSMYAWFCKEMSATWMCVSGVMCEAVTMGLSTLPLVMGVVSKPISFEQWLGLAIAAIAIWVYNLEEETKTSGERVYHAMANVPPEGAEGEFTPLL